MLFTCEMSVAHRENTNQRRTTLHQEQQSFPQHDLRVGVLIPKTTGRSKDNNAFTSFAGDG